MLASDPTSPDPQLAVVIARAERRRAMLERAAEIGMDLLEEIGKRTVDSPYHPEPRHEPGRAYAAVSRSVRLTLAFEARVDAEIVAMRNGTFVPRRTARREAAAVVSFLSRPETSAPVVGSVSTPDCPTRVRVRDAVWAAISREAGDVESAREVLDRLDERLIEGEAYDAYLFRPWRQCVEAVCANLGLSPDWSLWSDEAGFPKPQGAKSSLRVMRTVETKQSDVRNGEASVTAAPSRSPPIPPPGSAMVSSP